jgi:hypothetical protein
MHMGKLEQTLANFQVSYANVILVARVASSFLQLEEIAKIWHSFGSESRPVATRRALFDLLGHSVPPRYTKNWLWPDNCIAKHILMNLATAREPNKSSEIQSIGSPKRSGQA